MFIYLKHRYSGKIKQVKLGFSWTTFFFGLFVPLFRGDFKVFIPFTLLYMAGFYFMPYTYSNIDGMISFNVADDLGIYQYFSMIFYWIINILGAFLYNRIYTQGLLKKGYYPMSEETSFILKSKGIKVPFDKNQVDEDQE